ncbi:hypothetical protein ACS3UN_05185 [Oscillospiraceae bacterium LTW-04]|nr:hypothetical protein RBH76_05180 [Oscillospiraceae bacterium MB24-C1]
MSGSVSYELFNSRFPATTNGFTSEGGIYETFINKIGANSVKGTIVIASTSVDNAVSIAPAGSSMPIGIIYESGIADGSAVKVVVYGKAQVLLAGGQSATHGNWCGVSNSVAGRMYQDITPRIVYHYQEIGHSIQTSSSGVDVLSLVQVHFN